MAWNLDLDNDLRDAICISRTWVALAELYRQVGRTDDAAELEDRSKAALKHWTQKLPKVPLSSLDKLFWNLRLQVSRRLPQVMGSSLVTGPIGKKI